MAGVLGQSGVQVGQAVLWILVLVVCCVLLGVVLMRLRRHFFSEDEGSSEGVLPVSELRRLRDSGELSDEEYRRAIGVLADRAKGAGGAGPTGSGGGSG